MNLCAPVGSQEAAAYSVAVLRPRLLRTLCYIARHAGGDPQRICAGLGFEPRDLDDPERRFSFRQLAELLKRTLQVVPDPAALVQIAGQATITSYDMVGFAQLSCKRLRDAIELGVEFQRYVGMPADLALEIGPREFRFTLDEWFRDPEVGPVLVEITCAFALREFTLLRGRPFTPLRIELAYPATSSRMRYCDLFGCPVTFDAMRTAIVGDVRVLDDVLPTHDRLAHDHIVKQLRQTSTQQDGDLIEAIGHMLRKNLQVPPSVADVAAKMYMSERSLRRRLADLGISFRDLLGRVRGAAATQLMRDGQFTVEQVAELVGFQSAENFRRAFKRWTGQPPSALKGARRAI